MKYFRREMGYYNADWILCPMLTKIIADTDIENCASLILCIIEISGSHLNCFLGCFSILPATELVPGDIVEVGGMSSR